MLGVGVGMGACVGRDMIGGGAVDWVYCEVVSEGICPCSAFGWGFATQRSRTRLKSQYHALTGDTFDDGVDPDADEDPADELAIAFSRAAFNALTRSLEVASKRPLAPSPASSASPTGAGAGAGGVAPNSGSIVASLTGSDPSLAPVVSASSIGVSDEGGGDGGGAADGPGSVGAGVAPKSGSKVPETGLLLSSAMLYCES